MASFPNNWLVRFQPNPRARLRLFCFPYAGNGASAYRLWPRGLPPDVEVCALLPPGREARWQEAAFTEIPPLVSALSEALEPELERPFAFFGHSLGALVCFELARRLQGERRAVPEILFVSGRVAPHLPTLDPPITHLPDAPFVEAVTRRYHGIPRAVLEDRDLMQMFVRVLRSDLHALETYTHVPGPKLCCRIVAYGGDGDRVPPESLTMWSEHTERSFASRMFRGDHFFLNTARDELLFEVSRELGAVLAQMPER